MKRLPIGTACSYKRAYLIYTIEKIVNGVYYTIDNYGNHRNFGSRAEITHLMVDFDHTFPQHNEFLNNFK